MSNMSGRPSDALTLTKEQRIKSTFQIRGKNILNYLEKDREEPEEKLLYYQREAVLKTKTRFDQDAREKKTDWLSNVALIVAPPGSGKSGIIVLLPYVLKAKKVLLLTPSKIISSQLAVNFGIFGKGKSFFETTEMLTSTDKLHQYLPCGHMIESSSHVLHNNNLKHDLTIVNAQKFGGKSKSTLKTLSYDHGNRKGEKVVKDVQEFFRSFDLLIVDEAHHYPAPTWERIVNEFLVPVEGLEKKIVFLTATPYRDAAGNFILGKGDYAKSRITYNINEEETRQEKATRPCMFIEMEDSNVVTGHIQTVFLYQSTPFLSQAMVLVRTISEARNLVSEMNGQTGNPNFAVALTTKSLTAEEDEEAFSEGKYRVAVVCGKLLEGYDNPNVILCVILRNVNSQILFNQFIGRCMRTKKLPNREVDHTSAIVLTYKRYSQKKLWERREALAKKSPAEVDDASSDEEDTVEMDVK